MPLTILDPNTALIVRRASQSRWSMWRDGRRAGRNRVRAAARHLPRDGPTFYRNWIGNRAILSSPSEAGAHSQQRILNASSRREALPRLL